MRDHLIRLNQFNFHARTTRINTITGPMASNSTVKGLVVLPVVELDAVGVNCGTPTVGVNCGEGCSVGLAEMVGDGVLSGGRSARGRGSTAGEVVCPSTYHSLLWLSTNMTWSLLPEPKAIEISSSDVP